MDLKHFIDKTKNIYGIVIILITSLLEYLILDVSCDIPEHLHIISFLCIIFNTCIIAIFNFILVMVINRVWIALAVSDFLVTIIGLINHYVIEYHGSPLTISEISNFRTALNILGTYNLEIDDIALRISIFGIVILLIDIIAIRILENRIVTNTRIKTLTVSLAGIVLCCLYLFMGSIGGNPIKPKNTISWLWTVAYGEYGYVACVMEDFATNNNVISEFDDYNQDIVGNICDQIYSDNITDIDVENSPDIIFIVNESFFDLQHIADFETDTDYMYNIRNLNNIIAGYAVSPNACGGTNSSEYELLTSNSLYFMASGTTPFNWIDLTSAYSIVSHLKSLGYSTLAMHPASGANYNRTEGYKDLGFDNIHFGEDFENGEYYYNRLVMNDASVYYNLVNWYINMGDGPRFVYCLTIQNHGAYDNNEPECDTVHVVKSDFDCTDEVNEYLTSISMSDSAFYNLTKFFETVDREVIVCMVGDHSPTIASDVIGDNFNDDEQDLLLRETPFIIWANFDIAEKDSEIISMPFLVPYLLEIADVPQSGYYKLINEIRDTVPIITTYGKCYDYYKNEFSINDGSQYSEIVNEYLNVEYNNIGKNVERMDDFFGMSN